MPDRQLQLVAGTKASRRARSSGISTKVLLARALEAFREGRGAAWSLPALDVAQAQFEQHVLTRLTPADRIGLAKLAEPRERALALARRGDQQGAAASIKLAGVLLSFAPFSKEGRAYAKTLHHAAESYLSFRGGNHADAHARMIAAIEATEQLAAAWGSSEFIACRRVHLAHNLMRVDVARGATADAMRVGTRLLERLAGSVEPAAHSNSGPPVNEQIDARVAELFFNLVMETVAELLAALPRNEARHELRSLSVAVAPERHAGRGWTWLAIKSTAVGDDPRRFLKAAEPFLRAGRETTPTLWYSVALDLRQVYHALNLEVGSDAIGEIATELMTAPRVPACMRSAN